MVPYSMPPKYTKKKQLAKQEGPLPLRSPVARPRKPPVLSTRRKRAEKLLRGSGQGLKANLAVLAKLNKLAVLCAREDTLPSVLTRVVDAAIAITGADFGNIQLLDPASGDLKIVAHRGFPKWWVTFWNQVSKGPGVCGTALERGKRIIVEDVKGSPIFADETVLKIQLRAGVRAVQSTPLVTRSGKVIGMFSTHYKRPQRPDKHTLMMLDLLARQAADLLERARVEEVLRESEVRLRAFLENSAVIAWLKDENGRHVFLSANFEKRFGVHLSDWKGKTDFEVWPRTIAEEFRRNDLAVLAEGRTREVVERAIEPDGTVSWWLNSKFIFRDASRNSYVGGLGVDITERKRAEEALRMAHADLEQRISERTAELTQMTERLQVDIAVRQRAEEELRRHRARVEDLAGKLLTAQELERQRIARDLHDDFTQRLASLAVDAGLLERLCQSEPALLPRCRGLREAAVKLTDDVQQFAYLLHPSAINHLGLEAAIQDHIHEFRERSGLAVEYVTRDVPKEIPSDIATCLYRVTQESLQNVSKHAAASAVLVRLLRTQKGIGVCVHDDGKGFSHENGATIGGLGLLSMEERVRLLNGTFRVRTGPGKGTEVHACVPLPVECLDEL